MRKLEHPNIVKLLYFFFLNSDGKDDLYLNLILEYVPETVYKVSRQYSRQRNSVPILLVKLFTYQVHFHYIVAIDFRCFVPLVIFTVPGFAIVTLSHKSMILLESQQF